MVNTNVGWFLGETLPGTMFVKPLTSTPAPWANSNLGESVPVDKGVTVPKPNEELNQSFHLGAALYVDDLVKKKPDPEQHLHHHHHHLH